MDQILIIDDDVALCELVKEYLEPLGFQIEAVHRGDLGVERTLAGEHGRIITREELSNDVLHRSLSPFDRSIDMHISNLRRKLGHYFGELERIKTVRGVGYIYAQSNVSSGK